MLVIILKVICNCCPDPLKFLIECRKVIRSHTKPSGLVCTVVVNIDNHIHILSDTVINNVLHSANPFLIDGIVFIVNHRSPGDRNTHGIKSQVVYGINECLCSLIILPECLIRGKTTVSIHRIAQVPAGSHLRNHFIDSKHAERARISGF